MTSWTEELRTGRPTQPRIVVIGTGGTIAGSIAAGADEGVSYQAGIVSIGDLLAAVPGLAEVAEVEYEQFCQIDSCDMTLDIQLALARRVAAVHERADVDGVVITHGTDTLEETAYLLHLLVSSPAPTVLTGAMRPADAPGADGPINLLAAVRTALAPPSAGFGALVVLDGTIHSARDVRKTHTSRVGAFASPYGPLGEVTHVGATYVVRPVDHPGAAGTHYAAGALDSFDVTTIDALPPVEVVYGRAGLPGRVLQGYVESGARGLVYVGHGAGNVPLDLRPELARIAAAGIPVVRASRVGTGFVERDDAVPDRVLGLVAAGDLTPAKARILLSLALTRTTDPARIQGLFDAH